MFIPTSIPTGELDTNRILESIFQSLSFSEIFFILAINILITGLYIGMLSLFYNIRSKLIYAKKNFNPIGFCIVAFFITTLEPISRLMEKIIKRRFSEISDVTKTYKYFYRWFFNQFLLNIFEFNK